MSTLLVIPTQKEYAFFLESCLNREIQAEDLIIGKLPVMRFPDLDLVLSQGGLGKVQFAIHTGHLLDIASDWDLVICAGAAGALVDYLTIGDIVVATETVEHDINNKFGDPLIPRFKSDAKITDSLRSEAGKCSSFQVHFGPIASGDEDVVDADRREALHSLTGALAVAWEGAGGARASQFHNLPYVEIRGISDKSDEDAPLSFEENLRRVMDNVATLIITWQKGCVLEKAA
jgi:adenosylhomocysteine nucleosidase